MQISSGALIKNLDFSWWTCNETSGLASPFNINDEFSWGRCQKESCWSGVFAWIGYHEHPLEARFEAHLSCPDSIGRIHPRMLTTVHYPTRSWWNHVKWCVDLNLQQICMWNIPKTSIKCIFNMKSCSVKAYHPRFFPEIFPERSCSQLKRGSMEPSINLRRTVVANLRWPTEKWTRLKLGLTYICIYNYIIQLYIDIVDM